MTKVFFGIGPIDPKIIKTNVQLEKYIQGNLVEYINSFQSEL
jgi:hypothetical protein